MSKSEGNSSLLDHIHERKITPEKIDQWAVEYIDENVFNDSIRHEVIKCMAYLMKRRYIIDFKEDKHMEKRYNSFLETFNNLDNLSPDERRTIKDLVELEPFFRWRYTVLLVIIPCVRRLQPKAV